MSDMIINIEKGTRKVDLEQSYLGNDHENLQENLVFTFDEFVDGQARLEYEINDTKNYIILTKENETYTISVQNILTIYQEDTQGKIQFQLVVTEGTDPEEIPVFKSNIFYLKVRPSINAVNEAPEGYDLWIEQANTKLNQMDNLDIDAEKNEGVTTVTITKKDGTQETVEINDGETGPQGPPGPAGSGIPSGGTTGQVLAKHSNTDEDVEWKTIEDRCVTINVNQQTMELDKTAGEINSLIEQGYLILLMGRLMFIEEYDSSRDKLYAYFYSGGFATKFIITGNQITDYESLDVVYDNHYTHTDNNFSNNYKNKLDTEGEVALNNQGLVTGGQVYNALQDNNPMFFIEQDNTTMTLNHTAEEIYEAFTKGKLITAMGFTAFFKSYNNGVLQFSTYFGTFGQVITVQGNQITNVDQFNFVTE